MKRESISYAKISRGTWTNTKRLRSFVNRSLMSRSVLRRRRKGESNLPSRLTEPQRAKCPRTLIPTMSVGRRCKSKRLTCLNGKEDSHLQRDSGPQPIKDHLEGRIKSNLFKHRGKLKFEFTLRKLSRRNRSVLPNLLDDSNRVRLRKV